MGAIVPRRSFCGSSAFLQNRPRSSLDYKIGWFRKWVVLQAGGSKKNQLKLGKFSHFWKHFWRLCSMKNTSFLKQKSIKKLHFSLVLGAFSFCKIEKFLQVQKFFRIFTVAACKYKGDDRQTMGRSWATSRPHRNRVSQKKIRENFFTKKNFACKFRYYTHTACKII